MPNSSAAPLPFGELLKRSITFVRTYIGSILSLTILLLIPDLLTQLVVKLMVVPADTPGAITAGGTVIDGKAYGFSPLLSDLLVAYSAIELLAAFTFFSPCLLQQRQRRQPFIAGKLVCGSVPGSRSFGNLHA